MAQNSIADLDRLRGLGWSLWDPLGLDGAAPKDEYDTYLLGVVGIIRNGGTDDQAQAYLAEIETTRMGIEDGSADARSNLVAAVRRHVERFPPGRLSFR